MADQYVDPYAAAYERMPQAALAFDVAFSVDVVFSADNAENTTSTENTTGS